MKILETYKDTLLISSMWRCPERYGEGPAFGFNGCIFYYAFSLQY